MFFFFFAQDREVEMAGLIAFEMTRRLADREMMDTGV